MGTVKNKKQHILRVSFDADYVRIKVQPVTEFDRIAHDDVSAAREASDNNLRGYTDLNSSGDAIKLNFTDHLSNLWLTFACWGIDLEVEPVAYRKFMVNTQTVDLIKELQGFQSFEKRLITRLNKHGYYLSKSCNKQVFLHTICDMLNVVGGTVDFSVRLRAYGEANFRNRTFDWSNKNSEIELMAKAIDEVLGE